MRNYAPAPKGYRWVFAHCVYNKRTKKYIYPKRGKVLRFLMKIK